MSIGLIGRKMGMTHTFDEQGNFVAVTKLKAGPCMVLEIRKVKKNGYKALRLCFDKTKAEKLKKSVASVFKKQGLKMHRIIKEFRLDDEDEKGLNYNSGDILDVGIFSKSDFVDVTSRPKGKGFAGVVKRHNFSGGPKTHGSHFHRAPGSIGQCATPSRVHKGTKMPGRFKNRRKTVQNLQIVEIDSENGLLIVNGAVPGIKKGIVYIRKSIKKRANS